MKKSILMICLLGLTLPLSAQSEELPLISEAQLEAEQGKKKQKVKVTSSREKIGEVVLGVGGCASSSNNLIGNIVITYNAHKCVKYRRFKVVTVDPKGFWKKEDRARHYRLENSDQESGELVMEQVDSGVVIKHEVNQFGLPITDENGNLRPLSQQAIDQSKNNQIKTCEQNAKNIQANLKHDDFDKEMIADCFGLNN